MKILLSIGGASGSIYGVKLLKFLSKDKNVVTHLIASSGGKKILEHETGLSFSDLTNYADFIYENDDMFAGPASGSFKLDAMVICPCSMKTLSAVANGYCATLTSRAAVCTLKEGRKLILVPRETPFDLSSIENMRKTKLDGAVILPAMPGFYHKPEDVDALVAFVVGKILDQLGISHGFFKRWG